MLISFVKDRRDTNRRYAMDADEDSHSARVGAVGEFRFRIAQDRSLVSGQRPDTGSARADGRLASASPRGTSSPNRWRG